MGPVTPDRCDHWHGLLALEIVGQLGEADRLALSAHLDGCPDVDFGWTPATNTVPIRRLGLEVGETASITAASR